MWQCIHVQNLVMHHGPAGQNLVMRYGSQCRWLCAVGHSAESVTRAQEHNQLSLKACCILFRKKRQKLSKYKLHYPKPHTIRA
jgi:hypothetical protein